MSAISVNEQNFEEEVIKSPVPVLIDFWAEWCGPCKMVSPIVDELASELAGKLKVMKINVDEEQGLAAKYNVMSIPTLIVFKGGEVTEQIIGALSKDQILEKIKPQLG